MTLRTLPFAALAVLLAASAARADIILDDFSDPRTPFTITNPNPNPFTTGPTDIGGGTVRNATFTVTSPTPGTDSLVGGVGGGTVDIFFNSSSSGNGVIGYTFGTPLDFSAVGGSAGAVRLTTQSQPTSGNPEVAFLLSVQTATGTLSKTGSFANSSGFVDQEVALSSLTGTGDLSRVTGLSLTVNDQIADDFRLDKIALTQPQQVPAPPAAFLALAALPVLGLRRYLRRAV